MAAGGNTYIRELFVASNLRTFMRFLPGMYTQMDSEGACLNEGLGAARIGARVRSFAGMDIAMASHVRFSSKGLCAD